MAASCAHEAAHKPTRAEMRVAMTTAKARCLAAGQRWTAQRERALELLLEAGGPVKAYDLLAQFKEGAQTAPPTVYRALDTLVSLGLAHRIASLNAYTACHVAEEGHSASFLICDCCGAAEEIVTPAGQVLDAIRAQSAFQPSHITVEAHGRCSACRG